MAGLGQSRQLDHSGSVRFARRAPVIFVGVPRLKIFQKAVKRRVQAGHHADLASATPAKQIPLKSANGADDPRVSEGLICWYFTSRVV